MNRVVYCLFFSLLKVTLPSVIFNPEVQEQLYEFNISFTLNNRKIFTTLKIFNYETVWIISFLFGYSFESV